MVLIAVTAWKLMQLSYLRGGLGFPNLLISTIMDGSYIRLSLPAWTTYKRGDKTLPTMWECNYIHFRHPKNEGGAEPASTCSPILPSRYSLKFIVSRSALRVPEPPLIFPQAFKSAISGGASTRASRVLLPKLIAINKVNLIFFSLLAHINFRY